MGNREQTYPVTTALDKELHEIVDPVPPSLGYLNLMVEAVGAYEHGEADVEDVFADINGPWNLIGNPDQRRELMLQVYAAVVSDQIKVVYYQL